MGKRVKPSIGHRSFGIVLAIALAGCASLQRPSMERILQEGDCASVPDIDRLSINVSDHGSKVSFRWSGSRFAGTVLTSMEPLARDASSGANVAGEWDKRFPGISATTTVPGSYLGFPASSDPRAGTFVAAVYETQYPAASELNRAVVVVELKSGGTVLLNAPRRVRSIALSPKGDYVAILESTPAKSMGSLRDWFSFDRRSDAARFDVYATVYSTSGLVACTREVAAGLPAPLVNMNWHS